jgi:hypothetical protein
VGAGAAALIVWLASRPAALRAYPGGEAWATRDAQIARGRALRGSDAKLIITPCEYEHFALLAALGAPERATILPRAHEPVSDECPRVAIAAPDPGGSSETH